MSVINNTLADIANKDSDTVPKIVRAEVAPVQRANKLVWAVGGFTLSLCLGGWAVSQQATTVITPLEEALFIPATEDVSLKATPLTVNTPTPDSPTSKVIKNAKVSVYVEQKKDTSDNVQITSSSVNKAAIPSAVMSPESPVATKENIEKKAKTVTKTKTTIATDEPILIAKVTKPVQASSTSGVLAVEQVELTPLQLAKNAIERGKKELDSNHLDGAIKEFESALKYTPSDEITRKRLAALYYGKQDLRRTIEVLQHGIRLNEESQLLRISLSKILIKENQPEAALSPLIYLPSNVETEYLAMRAALSQQVKRLDLALSTYQILVGRQPDNARWWLGLAIQQERKMLYSEAKHSYQEAVGRVGVSKETQVFIRDRLALLSSLEDNSSAN